MFGVIKKQRKVCNFINIAAGTNILYLQKLANLGPGQYNLKSFVDDWSTVHKKRQGKFGKVDRSPKVPTERIFCSTLQQCPKEEV